MESRERATLVANDVLAEDQLGNQRAQQFAIAERRLAQLERCRHAVSRQRVAKRRRRALIEDDPRDAPILRKASGGGKAFRCVLLAKELATQSVRAPTTWEA